jgi:hypothetical protein
MSDLIPWLAPWSGRTLVLGVFLFGLLIALRGFICSRRSVPTCPRCNYNRSQSQSPICPECGHAFRSPRELFRRPRRWRWVIVGLLLAFVLPAYVVQKRVRVYGWRYYTYVGPVYWIDPYYTAQSVTVDGVTVEIERDRVPFEYCDRVIVRDADGRRVLRPFRRNDYRRWYVSNPDGGRSIGNLTNQAVHVALADYSGGAHCCFTHALLEIENERLSHVATLSTGNSGIEFEDINGDGIYEITLFDDVFAYWNTCFACSPMQKVILRWNGSRLVLATDLMRTSPPTDDELNAIADKIRWSWKESEGHSDILVPVQAWGEMLELIYHGHGDAALDMLTRAWPDWGPDREPFEQQFLFQLAGSHWAKDIAALNGGTFAQRLSAIKDERAAANE